ncbi:MAG: hypothetical protein IAI50_06080 [Candidatus Eremiobacteraeota bacterium]|nr:hypothetical protein [Candidatus Eremiobacteraeota bacterium]
MIGNIATERASRTLEFGMYRDGDNNLDDVQSLTIAQAIETSKTDRGIEFTVEDTTSRRGLEPAHLLRTESYSISDGKFAGNVEISPPHDMSARSDLTRFVSHVLDNAEKSGAKQTWIDLIDHGGGDGGGMQSTHSDTGIMREDDIAGAIADGVALHAKQHPEDAARHIDGVVANQCLMATVAFSSALSHAGVSYLAASPETMLAPGVPTGVAHDIARFETNPKSMARNVVNTTMDKTYGSRIAGFAPAAAFDVIDLDKTKIARVEGAVTSLNSALVAAAGNRSARAAIREDAKAIDGMVRFPEGKGMPWRADRPAIALYQTLSEDGRLSKDLRGAALEARTAIADTVLAHRESDDFQPFNDADYSNAYGPTIHFPVAPKQIDSWAPNISETDNAFYKIVGAADVARVIA